MKYLFYSFYRGALFISEKGDPEGRAWFAFCLVQFLNVFAGIQIIYWIFYREQKTAISVPTTIFIIISILILNYFKFLYKDRFRKLIKKYEEESKTASKRGILTSFYVIISIAVFFYAKYLQLG